MLICIAKSPAVTRNDNCLDRVDMLNKQRPRMVDRNRKVAGTIALAFFSYAVGTVRGEGINLTQAEAATQEKFEKVNRQFQVSYVVTQKFVGEAERFAPAHVGSNGTMERLALKWSAVHAWDRPSKKYYHQLGAGASADVPFAKPDGRRSLMSDGELAYRLTGAGDGIHATRDIDSTLNDPTRVGSDDLYRELLGMVSVRDGFGVKLRDPALEKYVSLLDILHEGSYAATWVTRRDERMLRLADEGRDEIFLDPARNFALVERAHYWKTFPGEVRTSLIVESFEEVEPKIWMPVRVKLEYFSQPPSSAPVVEAILVASKISLTPDPMYFRLPIENAPGIIDEDRGIAVDMADLEGKSVREFLDSQPLAEGSRGFFSAPVLFVVLSSFLLVAFLIFRRRRVL
ncbi:hypothetical protein [Crateriforma spongiae]|uniref:hypothetical protein n=1 Tax=Crateriforma spongiae TaxID=2724528 RepID=UPI001448047A|nr:hypothetical protein [Crateriforma spongiae]